MSITTDPTMLLQRWSALLAAEPGLRARNAAGRLGVGEAELVAARCGDGTTRLAPAFKRLLHALEPVGEVMVLTRNDHAVHEKHGHYRELRLTESRGVALNEEIDLRFFFRHWAHGFAVTEEGPRGVRESLQIFDRDGTAVHKIYRTDNTNGAAWAEVIGRFADVDQAPGLTPVPALPGYLVDAAERVDAAALRKGWLALADVHAFYPLLRRFRLRRIDALRLAGRDLARPVPREAWRDIIGQAAGSGLPIMVFVGSPGVVQIHTGPVCRLLRRDGWFNILDPRFNLHLREEAVAESWVVYKPNHEGGVTSLELYDRAGGLIGQLFGARKPGQPERTDWRALLAGLPAAEEVSHAV